MDDELQFFQTWWKILRKYWNPPEKTNRSKQADEFWDGLVDEGKDKVYSLCALKGFPAIKFGSTYRIDRAKYKKWLEEHEGMKVLL
ncbi:MAG: hypothetical protein MR384_07455 [Lachnospiraceae bacterium]|nr:hypothetical protein [Lachnospiraceae bacterium]MCI5587699.1 hypothetical protein [Lachnospiraceae bacterium]